MSYIDTGEDEVDYGEAEEQNAVVAFPLDGRSSAAYAADEEEKEEKREGGEEAAAAAAAAGAEAAAAEAGEDDDEPMAEEGYEDLYDDVDFIFEDSTEIGKDNEKLDLGEEDLDEQQDDGLPHNGIRSSSKTSQYTGQQRNGGKNLSEKQASGMSKLEERSSGQIDPGNEQIGVSPAVEKQVSTFNKLEVATVQKIHGNEPIRVSLSSEKHVPSIVKLEPMSSGENNHGNGQSGGQQSNGTQHFKVSLASEKQTPAIVKLEDMSSGYGNERLRAQKIQGSEQVMVTPSSEKQVDPLKFEEKNLGNQQTRVSSLAQTGGIPTQTALMHDSKRNETVGAVPGMLIKKAIRKEEEEEEEEEEEDLEMASDYVQTNARPKVKMENLAKAPALEVKAPSLLSQDRQFKKNDSGLEEAIMNSKGNDVYNSRASAGEQHISRKVHDSSNNRLRGNENLEQEAPQSGGNRVSVEPPVVNEYAVKSIGQQSNGCTMLFVGDLHWWTTDEELETALSEYGAVKTLKFFEERASGKSKGYCQVEFFDHSAAYSCKEGMNGKKFHGRPCLVAFANPRTIMQMGTAQVDKAQAQLRAQQAQIQSRRSMNNNNNTDSNANSTSTTTATRGGNTISYQSSGDNARGYGRQNVNSGGVGNNGRGSHGQSAPSGRGSGRGRGNNNNNNNNTGSKGMTGNGNIGGVTPFAQGIVGPMGGGLMMPQALLGQGYDPSYGPPRGGAGYGGYVLPGPPFTGMVQPFPTMGPGALAGVSPHVNPAFFGRNAATNGMGIMGGNTMVDSSAWGDGNMNGWGGDDHDRRGREASYGDDMGGSDYTYSNELAYERSRGAKDSDRADAEWPDRHRQREREGYREQARGKDNRDDKDDDWEKEKMSKSRNKGRSMIDDDERQSNQRGRSKEEEYGKRRRLGGDR